MFQFLKTDRQSSRRVRNRVQCRHSAKRDMRLESLEDRKLMAVFDLVAGVPDGAPGSLRDAITIANENGQDDIIQLAAGTYQLSLGGRDDDASDVNSVGDLDLTETNHAITIRGVADGTTVIDASLLRCSSPCKRRDRVFEISPGVTAVLENVTITGGFTSTGGGIKNAGDLTLMGTIVSQNNGAGLVGSGGGIANSGHLNVIESTLSDNSSLVGSGLYNAGTATITRSTVAGNSIRTDAFLLFGGGIYNAPSGELTITSSTLSDNHVLGGGTRSGGALFNDGGVVDIISSSIVGNSASTKGGGIANGVGLSRLAGVPADVGTVTVSSTIIAGNTVDPPGDDNSRASDLAGPVTSQGHNLIGELSTATIIGSPTGDMIGIDPLLGPLQDNGGPTHTHAPLPGSPVIDMGDPEANQVGHYDQRGAPFVRIHRGRMDVGAFESQPSTVPPVIGDANRDGRFDSSDLVSVFQAGEYEDDIAGNSTFEEGDWNGDGDFDSADLVVAFQAGTYVASAEFRSSRVAAIDFLFADDQEKRRPRPADGTFKFNEAL